MMRTIRYSTLAWSLALFAISANGGWARVAAQEPPPAAALAGPDRTPSPDDVEEGAVIAEIRVVGNRRVATESVLSRIRSRVGGTFSRKNISEDVKSLSREGGFFLRVDVDSATLPGGRVALVFRVEEKDWVDSVVCLGVVQEAEKDVLDVVKIRGRRFVNRYQIDLKARQLEEWYRRKGYRFAQVYARTRPGEKGGTTVAFLVDEGPQVKIDRIVFRGERTLDDGELEDILGAQTAGVIDAGMFNLEQIEADCVRLQDYYRERGFKDALVTLLDVVATDDDRYVTVVIGIDEGEPYVVDAIRFEGNKLFTDTELLALMKQKVGERYDGEKIFRDIAAVERTYQEQAYLGVKLLDSAPKVVYRLDTPSVELVYRISEGEKVRVGRIITEGNDITKDKVILRALTFGPGEYVDINEVERSIKRLVSLGYFEYGSGVIGPIWRDTGRPDVKDLVLKFKEGPTGHLRLAVGVGSDSGVTGLFQITKENFDIADLPRSFGDIFRGRAFSGGGQTLVLSLSPGSRISSAQLRFVEPFMFDTPWQFDASIFRNRRRFDSFLSERTGFNIGLGRRLDRDLGLKDVFQSTTSYGVEIVDFRDSADDIDVTVPVPELRVEDKLRIHSLEQRFRYASWDDPLLTTRGFEVSLSGSVNGSFLGGNTNFFRTEARGEFGIPIYTTRDRGIHVFGMRGRFGWSEEFGDSRFVPLVERFFLGGSEWLRGFDFQGVGPRDRNGEVTGGQAAWATSVEYRFPLYRNVLRGLFFLDAGGVGERITDRSFDDTRVSVGFGFRITIPVLGPQPFAIDVGFPVSEEDQDERRAISFTISRLLF